MAQDLPFLNHVVCNGTLECHTHYRTVTVNMVKRSFSRLLFDHKVILTSQGYLLKITSKDSWGSHLIRVRLRHICFVTLLQNPNSLNKESGPIFLGDNSIWSSSSVSFLSDYSIWRSCRLFYPCDHSTWLDWATRIA